MKPFDIKDRSFEFALAIVHFTNDVKTRNSDFVLSKQLLRSGTSIGAMIREAQNAESDRDFIHKLAVAQKECDETIYWLELISKSSLYNDEDVAQELIDEAEQLLKIIRTIILNKKRNTRS